MTDSIIYHAGEKAHMETTKTLIPLTCEPCDAQHTTVHVVETHGYRRFLCPDCYHVMAKYDMTGTCPTCRKEVPGTDMTMTDWGVMCVACAEDLAPCLSKLLRELGN